MTRGEAKQKERMLKESSSEMIDCMNDSFLKVIYMCIRM